jgi:NADPH:quinone reductase-like Zn-dependent oxidoreductase
MSGVYAELTAVPAGCPASPARAAARAVLGQVTAGQLSSRIAARFPLRHASEAHALLASRAAAGKILLQA